MKWKGRQRSSNIQDRRSAGGRRGGFGRMGGLGRSRGRGIPIPTGGRGGGMGLIGILVVVGIFLFINGINPLDMINGTGSGPTSSSSSSWTPPTNAGEDELAEFVSVVVKDTEDLWNQVFEQNGSTYREPQVVLFTGQTQSGCGVADARSGPFYCPNDQMVYIDLSFYDQLRQQFGAPGDFAQAYVIAHEVGHHVQNLTGVLPEFNRQRGRMSQEEQNAYSVRVELQADCYAGIWANYVQKQNLLEAGDVEEAITAANAIGDDTLTRGQTSPRNYTHGTSAQRMAWLRRGMETGNVEACDTFSAAI
ncbi:neutral zinc metallopeptidase [Devosia sp.]|uniref:KPN_02809 family neutral zinc metallopeptidase n=1 Tax=Devosia sp. TaxID=1871048 RepID=UPI003A9397C5